MPLDIDQFSSQLDNLVADVASSDRNDWLERARTALRGIDKTRLQEKLALHQQQRMPWLTAQPVGDLHTYHTPPPAPARYTIAAADGSNIPPDRHKPVRFYVLNAAWVRLTYGDMPGFESNVRTHLRHRPEDLYFDPDDRLFPVEGSRLSAKMAVAELEALRQAIESDDADLPAVALIDGTMILWMIQSEPEIRDELLTPYLRTLDWFYEQGIPVASYISSPGSFELANMLRVYVCPEPADDCKQCHTDEDLRLCYEVRDFRDPALLQTMLAAGERTCLFSSQSQILKHYGKHEIHYFYMNTGDEVMGEIARIETPQWVASDEDLLRRLHAALWDQCCRSGEQPPYPPALHEAHEKAVISTGDREVVERLLMERLIDEDVPVRYSAKALHKRTRGL